ncbi:MAG: Rrf2 family transcriptional regulator [Myxococcales bacterium]|nr:MAG: Rrf2 family transcriptional regulator [Myxococcales bacterium]
MKLSNKGRYGIEAVLDMAFHGEGSALQIKDIAERQAIPPRFLEQIFQDLKRVGLVSSKRGPKGGYRLAQNPAQIKLGDIIRAVEGPINLGCEGQKVGSSPLRPVIEEALVDLSKRIDTCLDGISIAQLCERGKQLGLHRTSPKRLTYVI